MTLSRRVLKRINSPLKSPKLTNSSVRKRALIRRLSSGIQFGGTSKANLKVVVRVRPENQREIDSNARSVIDIVDSHMLVFDPNPEEEDFFFQGTKQKFRDLSKKQHKEQKFIFERIFDPFSTNEDIFETTTKDIVDTTLNGYNCSVFAYGATGSGKTHTMIGNDECPGIIFLTVMELYKKIAEMEDTKVCELGVSYLEVYNELVRDLLVPGKPLNLHETGQHVQVTGLSLHKPKDASDLLRILAEGNQNRSQHPTDANSESSRSHAVFQVFVRQQERASPDIKSSVSIAKLSMIDLAGSERGAVTGFKGARFREGANINKSLLALGNCINALADAKGHIPYRDSKLTRLLKDSLGGNCRSVMIANVTRSSMSFEDTFNTLRYANRAKTIKTTLKKNLMNVDQHVSQYLKVIEDLKVEISVLKDQVKQLEDKNKEPVVSFENRLSNDEREMYEETIQALRKQVEDNTVKKDKETRAQQDFLETLMERNGELKNYQREILQLETKERELELQIFLQRLKIVRMNVFAFASSKLEKGIAKSERSIQSFRNHLEHILKRKEFLNAKLNSSKEKVVPLCEEFQKSCDGAKLLQETPDFFNKKLKQNELEQSARDSHQINEYLRHLVQQLLSNQTNNEKLLALLLVVTKNLYLRLRSLNHWDTETEDMLNKVYGMLDASRIEWADLKNTDNSFGEQSVSQHITLEPTIDIDKLTQFSVTKFTDLSPMVCDITKMYRRSNIKKNNNDATVTYSRHVNNAPIKEESTPVLQRLIEPSNQTPVSLSGSLLEDSPFNDDYRQMSCNVNQKNLQSALQATEGEVTPPNPVAFLSSQPVTPLSTWHPGATTNSSNYAPIEKETPSPVDITQFSQNCTPTEPDVRVHGKDLFSSNTPPSEITSPTDNQSYQTSAVISTGSTSAVVSLPGCSALRSLDVVEVSPIHEELNSTVTLSQEQEAIRPITLTVSSPSTTPTVSAEPSVSTAQPVTTVHATLNVSTVPPVSTAQLVTTVHATPTVSTAPPVPAMPTVPAPSTVPTEVSPDSPCDVSDGNRTITLSDANQEIDAEGDRGETNARVADSTFSLSACDPNGTFCIPSGESRLQSENPSDKVLRVVPPSVVKNKDNLNPNSVAKMFKKPRSPGITPSKMSYTRLPQNTNKFSFKSGFKKSASVSSLHNTGSAVKTSQSHLRGLESSLKKSTSFLKPKIGSAHKNQENLPPRAIAFGSSYSNPQRSGSSKRVLSFHPPVPPEQ